jgi:glycosyltransferase involved in cell wall biosynthesis
MEARLVIDARKLCDGGIGVYTRNLIDGLVALKSTGELVANISLLCYAPRPDTELEQLIQSWLPNVEVVFETAGRYSLREYFLLPRTQKDLFARSDLYHCPHYTLPFGVPTARVVTIHDAIHVTHPQTFLHKLIGARLISSALRRASAILTVSQYSAEQLKRLFSYKGEIFVTPNAAQPEIRNIAIKREKNGFCLFVGNAKPHKGLDKVIRAWQILEHDSRLERLPNLVVVAPQVTPKQKAIIRDSSHMMLLSWCPTEELNRLYNSAQAVLMPSAEEGFGLPVLEALLCGTPVVSSPLESVKEYFGDSVWYSEDFSAESFAQAVGEMLLDEAQRAQKSEKGLTIAAAFGKEQFARATALCYQRAIDSHFENADSVPQVFSPSVREQWSLQVA